MPPRSEHKLTSLSCRPGALAVLSVDIMDISGEHQNGKNAILHPLSVSRTDELLADVNHDMSKTRLSKDGTPIQAPKGKELAGDLERISTQKAEGYCTWFSVEKRVSKRDREAPADDSAPFVQAELATEEPHQQKDPTPAAATRVRKFARPTSAADGASSTPTRSSR